MNANRHEGLDLTRVEDTSEAEAAEFRDGAVAGSIDRPHPARGYVLLVDERPDLLKLHFRQGRVVAAMAGEEAFRCVTALTMLHWYIWSRQTDAVAHELGVLKELGATRAQVLEVIGLAFTRTGIGTLSAVQPSIAAGLATYAESDRELAFPDGWRADPGALRSGLDFSTSELSAAEEEALFGWYRREMGEVPRSVRVLARLSPEVLKVQRAKLERAMTGHLPKQLLPYIGLHFNLNRGVPDGVRESVLLARGWGVSKAQIMHAIAFAVGSVSGLEGAYAIEGPVAEVLEAWEDEG